MMYQTFIKPIVEFTIALLAIVFLLPLILFIIVLLSIANAGEPFFLQRRPGKNGRIFKIIKFRTMTNKTSEDGDLLPDSERLTTIGKVIRKTSIDEIPQLFNVLKGEMSLVGPRPLLPEYLAIYTKDQQKRHLVKPGLTGWAQVNGRNAISWSEKLKLDVWYVENISWKLDLRIIFRTIKKVVLSEGVNSRDMATTEPFNGKN